jgi:putative transposase
MHHVISRGIEKGLVFEDDVDRHNFLGRLTNLAGGEQLQVLAFSLLPNHFHLLVRTLKTPLSVFMSRLLTGYSCYFNKRHERSGHLFQNRFKSFVVDEESYFLELVRYIHLNPVRAGLVKDLKALSAWPFAGHSALMGNVRREWLDSDAVLSRFGPTVQSACQGLSGFMEDGLVAQTESAPADVIRLTSQSAATSERAGPTLGRDARILGSSEFAERVLEMMEKPLAIVPKLSMEDLIKAVASNSDLTVDELCSGSRRGPIVKARSIAIWLGVKQLGFKPYDLAARLQVKSGAIYMSLAARKGEVGSRGIDLEFLR